MTVSFVYTHTHMSQSHEIFFLSLSKETFFTLNPIHMPCHPLILSRTHVIAYSMEKIKRKFTSDSNEISLHLKMSTWANVE